MKLEDFEIELCELETNHAQIPGTNFCRCTHAMYDGDDCHTYGSLESAGFVGEFLPPTDAQMVEYLESEVVRLLEKRRGLIETVRQKLIYNAQRVDHKPEHRTQDNGKKF